MSRDLKYRVTEMVKEVISGELLKILQEEGLTASVVKEGALSIDIKVGSGKGSAAKSFRLSVKERKNGVAE